jgi:hypothetical protein
MVPSMGAVAAPRSSRPAGPVSLAAAALVALAAAVILLVAPGPAAPAAAPPPPIPDQTGPVAFRSLGATYLSAPADPSLHPAFADVQNAGHHPITVTSVLLPQGARLDDIAIKRISRSGATFVAAAAAVNPAVRPATATAGNAADRLPLPRPRLRDAPARARAGAAPTARDRLQRRREGLRRDRARRLPAALFSWLGPRGRGWPA